MQQCDDLSEFDWIRLGREKRHPRTDAGWQGYFVSQLMPSSFDAYVKVLHRISANYEWLEPRLTPEEIAILQIPPCEPLRALIADVRAQGDSKRIRWRTLAQFLGVPFEPRIVHEWFSKRIGQGCGRFLGGPQEGSLQTDELAALVSILLPFAGRSECFFRRAEVLAIATNQPLLFKGNLTGLEQWVSDQKPRISPEYWWPKNRTWCVCSDYDVKFTIIGGPKELVSAISNREILECIDVTPATRIDSLVQMP